jgi:transposase
MTHHKSESEQLVKAEERKRAKGKRVPQLSQVDLDAAGTDVGAESHFVAVPEDRDEQYVREFGAFTVGLLPLGGLA